jgi:hypothetical protein
MNNHRTKYIIIEWCFWYWSPFISIDSIQYLCLWNCYSNFVKHLGMDRYRLPIPNTRYDRRDLMTELNDSDWLKYQVDIINEISTTFKIEITFSWHLIFIVNLKFYFSLCFKLLNFRFKNVSNVLQINKISNWTNEMQQGVENNDNSWA